jgi:molybdopterin-guanine dinucleotide biosynthesis protein A
MKRLGAVLAGGLSTRFGSDKALALLEGARLLDRAAATFGAACDAVVIVGRDDPAHSCIPDWPAPGLGPLGGLAAALRHARDHAFGEVLSCGVDSVGLPSNLLESLAPAPSYLPAQPIVGLWPVSAAEMLEAMLVDNGNRAVRAFAERIGARPVTLPRDPDNVNYAEDLERIRNRIDRAG